MCEPRFVIKLFLILLIIDRDSVCYQSFSFQYSHKNAERFVDEGNKWLCIMLGFCTTFDVGFTHQEPLTTVYKWSQLEFDYPSSSEREEDIRSRTFIPGQPAPIDMDVYYGNNNNNNKIFISIPRFQEGIPVTLGVVTDRKLNNNPLIKPYPEWRWHRNPKRCSQERIVSVYRTQIDECGRLWVLDTGILLEEQVCPPQILAFDLKNDKLVHRYEIPSSQIESRSILVTPIVDVRDPGQCQNTFVYVADCQTYSIIVYDVQRKKSWKATDKTMYPYPNYGTFNIAGDSFDLMDGVLGMAIEPLKPGYDRKLYYHALSSPTENWVYTSVLRNESRFQHDPESSPDKFNVYRGTRDTQSAAEAMNRNGIMFFGLMSHVTLNCWNSNTEYGMNNIGTVADNKETLQFASGLKIIPTKKGTEELWVMTSRFQKVATGTLNSNEINFRIQAGKVEDLLFNSKCKKGSGGHSGGFNTGITGQHGNYGLIRPGSNRPSNNRY